MSQEYYSIRELASLMGMAYTTVYRMVKSGQIESVRFGRSFRVHKDVIKNSAYKPGKDVDK